MQIVLHFVLFTRRANTEWLIHSSNASAKGTSGIHLFSAVDTVVQHNIVHNNPYTAMTIVWPVPQVCASHQLLYTDIPSTHATLVMKWRVRLMTTECVAKSA